MLKRLGVFVLSAAVLSASAAGIARASAKQISGAGATFPYPVYSKWAQEYNRKTGVQMNYQAIGSGGGIKQIKARTVDFGASDAPLKEDELDKFGLLQWPMIMGGVVPIVNIPGVKPGEMRLDNPTLAKIFLGEIKRWNDPAIKKLNPGLDLPDSAITVVHRSDGSGTTFNFTNYLAKVSPTWKQKIGFGKAVDWPTGVGGKGNQGVANYVGRIKGAVGYVEYAYALENDLAYTQLRNRAGNFVKPDSKSFQAAAANADWKNAPGFYLVLTDQPGAQSWPITAASFILMYREQRDPATAKAVLEFLDWSYHHGQAAAEKLDYVPMPASVVNMVEGVWHKEMHGPDGKPIW
ncbi:MAG TPA: phosphate ABC transporter substrate-binding protein PstS [Gammaproteobacteria bacterium]|nr:phosphate ABC transporter substrate-binding protein PstS [Gammaproteobacteria bacterium]